ncbi:Hypothetical protein POVR1_LOCUS281 [uncultured virus]|nr:Hypothetical protein POVR1_LOCUS281 [uncultured virus]
MDEPEETIDPFVLPEILVQLLIHSDRSNDQILYQSYKELMDSPYFLRLLQTHYRIPFQPLSFYDFVFERDIRDPINRKNLCASPERMLIYAVKSNDPALVESLLKDDADYVSDETLYLAGTIGNPEVIDRLIPSNGGGGILQLQGILEGLAYGSHNQLFDRYSQIKPVWTNYNKISEAAARGGNLPLVIRLYNPNTRDATLEGAAIGNHQDIIRWIFDQSPETSKDQEIVILGAIQGGNLQLANNYLDAIGDTIWHFGVLRSVAMSDDPKVLGWFLSSDLTYDKHDLHEIYDLAIKGRGFHNVGSYRIAKRILENYDELNSIHNLFQKVFRGVHGGDQSGMMSGEVNPDYKSVYRLLGTYKGKGFRIVPDIIEYEKESGYHLAAEDLKKVYNQEWMDALEKSIQDDNLEFTKWVINKFRPDQEILTDLVYNVKNCTAEWIRRTYN